MRTVAFIFMVIGVLGSLFTIGWLSLLWTAPMTFWYYYKSICDDDEDVSVAFKVCSLLFVSLIGGIVMLCDYRRS